MQPVTPTAKQYDARTMFFHWATAALVVTQLVGAWTIDLFPRGPLRVDARSVHITLDVLLAVILALAGLHALAALFHRYFWRDGVLGRMLPGR